MRADNHQHAAFKRYRLVGITDNVATVDAEIYNPDGSTFQTTMSIRLEPPKGIEATMNGGPFDGARIKHISGKPSGAWRSARYERTRGDSHTSSRISFSAAKRCSPSTSRHSSSISTSSFTIRSEAA